MAWAGGGAGAPLAISATETEVAEVLADVAEVLADVAGASAAWCSEGALQPTAKNVKPIANTRIGVTVSQIVSLIASTITHSTARKTGPVSG